MNTPLPAPFRGETISLRSACGASLSENVYTAGSSVPRHTHEAMFFSLTLSGGYVERDRGRDAEYAPASVSFHPAFDEHSLRIGERNTRCLNVELGPQWNDSVPHSALIRVDRGPLLWLTARLCAAFRSPAASDIVFENLILEMLGCVTPQTPFPRQEPRWLHAVDETVRSAYRTNVTVAGLARSAGMHPVHLSRTWRRFRGTSIARFIHRLRIEDATRLLADRGLSVADVALELGFADQPHFSHVFRTLTGTTPAAFRRTFG